MGQRVNSVFDKFTVEPSRTEREPNLRQSSRADMKGAKPKLTLRKNHRAEPQRSEAKGT